MLGLVNPLRIKFFLILFVTLSGIYSVLGWGVAIQQKKLFVSEIKYKEADSSRFQQQLFLATLENYLSDALILSDAIRNEYEHGLPLAEIDKSISDYFMFFAVNRPYYDQIRFISPDGMEQIRLDWDIDHGIVLTPRHELQNKKNRIYFKKGMAHENALYVSAFDLNIENNTIEKPFKPMIRITNTVKNNQNEVIGLVVLNLLGKNLLNQLKRIGQSALGEIYFINDKGQWIIGPHPEDAWGFMFPGKEQISMADQFPVAWRQLQDSGHGQRLLPGGLFTFSSIDIRGMAPRKNVDPVPVHVQEKWYIVSRVLNERLCPAWWQMVQILLFVGLVFSAILSWYIAYIQMRRSRAMEDVRQNERKLKIITDTVQDGIAMADASGTVMFWNRAAEKMFGFSARELMGKDLHQFITPDHYRADAARGLEDFSHSGEGYFIGKGRQVEALRKDGSLFHAELNLNAIQMEGKWYAVGVVRDISERIAFEKALATREVQLEMFIRHTPAAVAMFDMQIRYLMASDRWYQDYGLEGKEIIGISHYEIFPEIHGMEDWKEIHKRCLAGAVVRREEDPFEREDGRTEWLRWEVRPWRNSDDEVCGIIMFTEVITRRKEAEGKIKKLNEHLEARVKDRTLELESAVTAIANRERMAKLLKDVASISNIAMSVSEALETTLTLIAEFINWPVGHVYMPDDDGTLLSTPLWYLDNPHECLEFINVTMETSFQKGEGLPGHIFLSRKPHWIEDVKIDYNFPRAHKLNHFHVRGAFGFPVITKNGVVAVLEFFSTEVLPRDNDIIAMAEEVGRQLSYVVERKRIEQMLQDNEEIFRGIFNQSFQIVGLLSVDGKILKVNDTAMKIIDMDETQIIGEYMWLWWCNSKTEAQKVKSAVERAAGGEAVRFETILLTREKSIAHIDFSIKPIIDDKGNVLYLIPEGRDITERKRVEAEMEKLALVVRKTSNGVIITDKKGCVEWINEGFTRISGYTLEEIVGKKPGHFLQGPKTDPGVVERIRSALSRQEGIQVELMNCRKSGECYWIELDIEPVFDDAGKLVNFIAIENDITARKTTNDVLVQFRNTLDQTHDAVFIFDLQTLCFSYVNQGGINQLGYSLEEMQKMTPLDIKPYFTERQFREKIEPLVKGDVLSLTFETTHQHKSGRNIPVEILLQYVDKERETSRFVAIVRDITEQKRILSDLEESRDDARQAAKAKTAFLANMSHEIRTPMNAILGMAYLLNKTELTPNQENFIEKIQMAGNNLLNIINDILDFSKIEAGQMKIEEVPFELDSVLSSIADMVAVNAQKKDLELLFYVRDDVPLDMVGDPLRIGQILINLANNAVKFTFEGEVLISVLGGNVENGRVLIHFMVQDTGIGMSLSQVHKLFQPFSQADASTTRKFGGTGLGLAICQQLSNLMGGELWVESEEGKGSTFHFKLFLACSQETNRQPLFPSTDLRGMRVLVLDDNATFQEIIKETLESFSFQVTLASRGQEAIDLLEAAVEDEKPIKLVLADWKMPGMDGLETSRRIKNNCRICNTPTIIMITAFAREDIIEEIDQVGIDGFLVKPVNRSLLFNTIMECFGKSVDRKKEYYGNTDDEKIVLQGLEGLHVLLAEDNLLNQEVARELLETVGVSVTVVENGRKAVNAFIDTAFDAVLMDMQMPEMDGYEAIRLIRSRENGGERVPIISMTANVMAADRERARSAGADDQVDKPITPSILYTTLAHWTNRKEMIKNQGYFNTLDHTQGKADIHLPVLPGLDVMQGLHRFEGNRGIYARLLRRFKSEQSEMVQLIQRADAENDNELTARLLHTLKGLAATIGASPLAKKARLLERQLLTQGKQLSEKEISILGEEMKQVLNAITKVLSALEPGSEQKEHTVGATLETSVVSRLLSELEALLRADDYGAHAAVEVLIKSTAETKLDTEIQVVKKDIERYNYTAAIEGVEMAKKKLDSLT